MAYVNLKYIFQNIQSLEDNNTVDFIFNYFHQWFNKSFIEEEDHGSEKQVFKFNNIVFKKYKNSKNIKHILYQEYICNEIFSELYDTELVGITQNGNLIFQQNYIENFFDNNNFNEYKKNIIDILFKKGFIENNDIFYKYQYYHIVNKKTKDFFKTQFNKKNNIYFIKDNYFIGDINRYNTTWYNNNLFIYDATVLKIQNKKLSKLCF